MSKIYTSIEDPYTVEESFKEARRMLTESNHVSTRVFWDDPINKQGEIPIITNRAENIISLWYHNGYFEDN